MHTLVVVAYVNSDNSSSSEKKLNRGRGDSLRVVIKCDVPGRAHTCGICVLSYCKMLLAF